MYRALALCSFVILLSSTLVLGTLMIGTTKAHAQLDSSTGVDPITLDVEPEYPAPYQTVSITPSSTVFDTSSAKVTVTVNGKLIYTGTGGAPISVPMSGPGSISNITVKASAGGQSYSKSIQLQPANVALVIEPVSTTHPFYQGKGLVSSEGQVRLIAIPDLRTSSGKIIDPTSLEYTWKFGDQVLEDDSGIGKNVLNATAPEEYRDADVQVTVSDPNSTEIAQSDVTVSPTDPLVRIYENDPLLGPLYDTALSGSFTMPDTEDTYRAVPYYFSETPAVSWLVNGTQSGTADDITVRATGNGEGSAVLNFTANQTDTTQTANSTVSVNFGQAASPGLFGL